MEMEMEMEEEEDLHAIFLNTPSTLFSVTGGKKRLSSRILSHTVQCIALCGALDEAKTVVT